MTRLRNVAIVSFAQEPIVARDQHRTAQEMLYPPVVRALEQAGVGRDAIDYQTAGSADYIDGRPFGFVQALDYVGSWPPRQDLHLEMDAAFAAYYAWLRIQTGEIDSALVVGYGKTSEGRPEFVLNLELDPYYQAAIGLDPASTAALQASAYIAHSGVSDMDLAAVVARSRAAGARNPDAQLREPLSAEQILHDKLVVSPLRRAYLPPVGESAVCLILAAEGKAEGMCRTPAWIQGVDQRAELQTIGSRDLARSQSTEMATRNALRMAGLGSAREVDVIEMLATTPVEELILRDAMGLERDGGAPAVNPSGGPITGHPLLLSGLIRLGEVFRQLSGQAGQRAVPGATRAIAHASQGHCLQHNLVWVIGRERRWS